MAQARSNGGKPPKQNGRPQPGIPLDERKVPYDNEAEVGVLGSAVLLFECLDEVAQILTADDFHSEDHQKLYRHLVAMHENGRRFDITLLTDRLKASGEYATIGGTAGCAKFLSSIINAVPNAAHAIHYAEIVKGHSTARKLIHGCTEILQDAYDASGQQNELVARAEAAIARVSDSTIQGRDTRCLNEVVQESLAALNTRMANGGAGGTLNVGLDAFNNCMGLKPGGVTIIAGRPSMGKSSVAVNVAMNVARQNQVVYFASLEMTATELADRMLSSYARVDCQRMMTGRIQQDDRLAIVDAANNISQWPMYFDDRPSMTMAQIGAACRRLKRRRGRLDLVVIDYLQLVEPENSRDDRVEQLAKISRGCKRMARELEAPLVVLAQVNRSAAENTDKRPRLHQLKGCGDIEQDADSVVFCYRPAVDDPALKAAYGQSENAELIMAKNRNGPAGTTETLWWPLWMTWANKSRHHTDEQCDQRSAREQDCGEREFQ